MGTLGQDLAHAEETAARWKAARDEMQRLRPDLEAAVQAVAAHDTMNEVALSKALGLNRGTVRLLLGKPRAGQASR